MAYTYSATSYAGDTGVASTVVAVGDSSNDASAAPFAARVVSVTVNFGITSDSTRTSVTGVPWVKNSPRPIAYVIGRPAVSSGASDDMEVLAVNVRALVTNIVDGTSFDVVATATETTSGTFVVQIMGV